jgi:hypothetical protein
MYDRAPRHIGHAVGSTGDMVGPGSYDPLAPSKGESLDRADDLMILTLIIHLYKKFKIVL